MRPFLDDLLARYDEVVTEVVVAPAVVRDRDHPAVEDSLGLFGPGSDFSERSLDGWRANAEADVVLRPVTGGELVTVSHLEGDPTAVSDEEVVFARCVEQGYVRLEDGEETERVEGQLLPRGGNRGAGRRPLAPPRAVDYARATGLHDHSSNDGDGGERRGMRPADGRARSGMRDETPRPARRGR